MTPTRIALARRLPGTLAGSILALALTTIAAPTPVTAAEPLKLGVPPGARPTPVIPPDQGVHALPAPETHRFVGPLSRPTRTGRAGVALWGAPGTATSQRGPGDPDSVGWAGGGVAVEWGGPPRSGAAN